MKPGDHAFVPRYTDYRFINYSNDTVARISFTVLKPRVTLDLLEGELLSVGESQHATDAEEAEGDNDDSEDFDREEVGVALHQKLAQGHRRKGQSKAKGKKAPTKGGRGKKRPAAGSKASQKRRKQEDTDSDDDFEESEGSEGSEAAEGSEEEEIPKAMARRTGGQKRAGKSRGGGRGRR